MRPQRLDLLFKVPLHRRQDRSWLRVLEHVAHGRVTYGTRDVPIHGTAGSGSISDKHCPEPWPPLRHAERDRVLQHTENLIAVTPGKGVMDLTRALERRLHGLDRDRRRLVAHCVVEDLLRAGKGIAPGALAARRRLVAEARARRAPPPDPLH